MAAGKTNFFWDRLVPTIYSAGAAIVVLGAMAKIQHITSLGWLLTAGLIIEAVIFGLYALQSFLFPVASSDYEWERVYPELAKDYKGEARKAAAQAPQANGLTANMDQMLAQAKITPDVFEKLGTGFRSLSDSVSKMRDISDATVATNDYARNVKTAAQAISDMNKSYGTAITAMNAMADATTDAKEYRTQFQKVTQSMGALNAVYELELQDTNKHLKAMNAFYGNLSAAMQNMADASRDTQQFKNELSKLTGNLTSLNNVYGSMLTAMRGQK
ncbi:type IX secretion system motor protein PorL/GldL [Arsenicibacter rosenii]|uniref:Gliding motility protein GldL n=1 Tax=Arsenicibacter rosenii TaxID=1750698 RepID=A0A1S2VKZ8_9BACT|nr:gliding motility protein GldL [Arsenicibacter rosenii]OIN58876.1 gliding motility protein GldL [Arsenicibacter rosenii]